MDSEEREEALVSCLRHYGFPVVLNELTKIVDIMKQGMLSVPLDKDPEKAALVLFAERMKIEGAVALLRAFSEITTKAKGRFV